eukprot:TRINITY_DN27256_c0_g1_i1.p1 TRINITY_DN27256_c0_g1~~TRINITY_DN27256_c0_g1_i1.p1  ORF type:complete len:770 (+),score=265.35 TRINITY_DN27256_c0_g1_i1:82-2391(+)
MAPKGNPGKAAQQSPQFRVTQTKHAEQQGEVHIEVDGLPAQTSDAPLLARRARRSDAGSLSGNNHARRSLASGGDMPSEPGSPSFVVPPDRDRAGSVFAINPLESPRRASPDRDRRSIGSSPRQSFEDFRRESRRSSLAFGVSQNTQEILKCMKGIRATLAELRRHIDDNDATGVQLTGKLVEFVNRLGCGLVTGESLGGEGDAVGAASRRESPPDTPMLQPPTARSPLALPTYPTVAAAARQVREAPGVGETSGNAMEAAGIYAAMEGMLRDLVAERASLYLYHENKDSPGNAVLISAATVGRAQNGKPIPSQKTSANSGLLGQVFQTGLVINIVDATAVSDEVFNRFVDQRTGLNTRNTLCIPIKRVAKRGGGGRPDAEEQSNPKDHVGVLEFLNKLPPTVKRPGAATGTMSHFTAADEAKGVQYARLMSVMLAMFRTDALNLVEMGAPLQRFLAARTTDGLHCRYAQNTSQGLSRTGEKRRQEGAQRVVAAYAAKVDGEDPWDVDSEGAQQRRQADEEGVLVYRTGAVHNEATGDALPAKRAVKVTDSAGSLREVQLYVERLEECWKNARRRNVELETVIESLKGRRGEPIPPMSPRGPSPLAGQSPQFDSSASPPAATPSARPPPAGPPYYPVPDDGPAPPRLPPHIVKNVMAYFQLQLRKLLGRHKDEQQALLDTQKDEAERLRQDQLFQLEHQQHIAAEAFVPPWSVDPARTAATGNKICTDARIPSLWHTVPAAPDSTPRTAQKRKKPRQRPLTSRQAEAYL